MKMICSTCGKSYKCSSKKPQYAPPVCSGSCFVEWLREKSEYVLTSETIPYDNPAPFARSKFENSVADLLVALGLPFEFERHLIETDYGTWYLPDFYLPGLEVFIEAKGEWRGLGAKHVQQAVKKGYGLVVIDEPVYRRLSHGLKSTRKPK